MPFSFVREVSQTFYRKAPVNAKPLIGVSYILLVASLTEGQNKSSIIPKRFAATLSLLYFEYGATNGWELRIPNGGSFNKFDTSQ